jgi:hypothetical protein
MRPKLQKQSELKLAGRMNETQILQTQCRNICKLNSSREAEDNATSRGLRRIPTLSESGVFQVAGLNIMLKKTRKFSLLPLTEDTPVNILKPLCWI